MKYLQITILLVFSSSMFSQQNSSGVIEYTIMTHKSDSYKMVSEKNTKMNSFLSEPSYFTLTFTKNESLYSKKSIKMKSDTKKNNRIVHFLDIVGGGSGIYHTDNIRKKVLLQKEAYGEFFLISHKLTEWEITQEIKRIGKYTCYKAIRKDKDYETRDSKMSSKKSKRPFVWFTPEIPVPYGPGLYNGLPGLVLEVNWGKIIFKTTKITLNPTSKIIIKKPKKGINISEKEYYKKATEIGEKMGF